MIRACYMYNSFEFTLRQRTVLRHPPRSCFPLERTYCPSLAGNRNREPRTQEITWLITRTRVRKRVSPFQVPEAQYRQWATS